MALKWIIAKPYLLIASILCLALGQCKDFEDCRSLYSSMVSIELLPNNQDHTQTISFDSLKIDIAEKVWRLTSKYIQIALNPAVDSTTFYLYSSNPSMRVDTVTIFYQRQLSLISPQCGAQQEYVLDSLYTTFINDSILHATPKTKADKSNQVDVQIFY